MSIRTYIWGLVISTLLALSAWIFVVFYIDPEESGIIGQVFFYASLFLFLSGLMVTFFVWLRKKFIGEDVAIETIGLSFRQGVILATFPILIIILFSLGYLIWWSALLVLSGVLLLELFFLSRDK